MPQKLLTMLKTQKSESEYHANRFWGWVCCNNQECVFTWLVGSSGQTEVIYSGRWRSYHYTQTVRRLKSLTGGNWIQVVTHSTSWSCRDGGLQTSHTHTHTHTHERWGPQSISHCLSQRRAPPTWIRNNLPLKAKDDTRWAKHSRRVGTDGEAIEPSSIAMLCCLSVS